MHNYTLKHTANQAYNWLPRFVLSETYTQTRGGRTCRYTWQDVHVTCSRSWPLDGGRTCPTATPYTPVVFQSEGGTPKGRGRVGAGWRLWYIR